MFACTKFRFNRSRHNRFRLQNPPQNFGVKVVAFKKYYKKYFARLYISSYIFYPHQSTFGRDKDFFLFLPKYRTLTSFTIPSKHKKNSIKCGIVTYKQCKQELQCTNNANKIREILPKKLWWLNCSGYYIGYPIGPKDLEKSTRLCTNY